MFPAFGFLERTRHRGHRQVVPLDRLGVLRAGQIHDRLGFGLLEIFGQGRGDLAAPPRGQAPPAIVVQFGAHFQTVRQDHVVGTQQAVQARKNPKMRGGTAVLGGLPAVDREASVHITLEQTHRWLSVSRTRSLP